MAVTAAEFLEQQRQLMIDIAATAMRAAGKRPEMPVLRVLSRDSLREIIDYYGSPVRPRRKG